MSISKNNESSSGLTEDENGQVVDLREVMRQYDEMGLRPQGFVFMYGIQDADEVDDGTQLDTLMRSMALKYEMEHRKRVFMAGRKNEQIALVRHELGWFGAWEGMADLIETIEADIRIMLETFVGQGSVSQVPTMDFMFANQEVVEDMALENMEVSEEDEELF